MSKGKRLAFYSSRNWQHTREAYKKSVGGLCEGCLKEGIYKAGVIVHHKIHLDDEKLDNPKISLCFDNLELVCRECHDKRHNKTKNTRYKLDELGRVIFQDEPTESINHSSNSQRGTVS